MLSRFVVKNFKSIGERGVDLELKPLTVLFGPQGSGKSNILEILWRFAEVLRGEARLSHLQLVEPRYDRGEELFHREEVGRKLTIGLYAPDERGELGWKVEYWIEDALSLITQEVTRGEKTVLKVGFVKANRNVIQPVVHDPAELNESLMPVNPEVLKPAAFKLTPRPPADKGALTDEATSRSKLAQDVVEILSKTLRKEHVSKVALLTPLRGRVSKYGSASRRIREIEGELCSIGPDGEMLIEFLSTVAGSRRYKVSQAYISKWASEFGLAEIYAGFSGREGLLSLDYEDSILKTVIDVARASHGARQVLCVIAQLFSPDQDIVLIEEPELSLHPESVAKLPLMFLDAIKLGKQIIITTHSTILPLALSRMARKAREEGICANPNELIAVYEIEKTPEGTTAARLYLDEGGYIKGYVGSFFRVESELLKEWEESLPE